MAGLLLDAPALRLATKPVPAVALALLVVRSGPGRYRAAIAVGLFLSAIGDVLLELPGRFVPGLVAFLVAHVAYTTALLTDERRLRLLRAAPFAAWMVAVFQWLRHGLGDMAGPVAVYMLAIGAMMWRAAARVGGPEARPGARTALAGAILFALSDTLIAVDRFRAPLPLARYAIMVLYWAGQAGIAVSALPIRDPRPAAGRASVS